MAHRLHIVQLVLESSDVVRRRYLACVSEVRIEDMACIYIPAIYLGCFRPAPSFLARALGAEAAHLGRPTGDAQFFPCLTESEAQNLPLPNYN